MPRNPEGNTARQLEPPPVEELQNVPKLAPKGKREHVIKPHDEAEPSEVIATPETLQPKERSAEEGAIQMHLALAEAALVSAKISRDVLKAGEMTDVNAWEHLHNLRSWEIGMEEYLEEAWKRTGQKDNDPEVIKLVEAITTLQRTIRDVREEVESGHVDLAAREYADALEQALGRVKDDVDRSHDVRKDLQSGSLNAEQRSRYLDALKQRVEMLEKELGRLDALPNEEKVLYDNTASYEATTLAITDVRETIHELIKADTSEKVVNTILAEEELAAEDVNPLLNNTADTLNKLELQLQTSGIKEKRRQEELIKLSKTYANLEEYLHVLQTGKQTKESKQTLERISQQLEDINTMRTKLHVEPKGSDEVTPIEHFNAELRNHHVALRKELKDIEKQQKVIDAAIEVSSGMTPEEITAHGGLFFKRAWNGLLGKHDFYADWKRLEDRASEIRSELGVVAQEGTTRGKVAARRTNAEHEADKGPEAAERLEQRGDASAWLEMRGRAPANTEEEFFFGTMEAPTTDVEMVRADPNIIEEARKRGVKDPEHLWFNIANNPVSGSLSFDENEYIELLSREDEMKSLQGNSKNPLRYLRRHWLRADQEMLMNMRNELMEHGIDPKTGLTFKEESVQKRKARNKRRKIRRKLAA